MVHASRDNPPAISVMKATKEFCVILDLIATTELVIRIKLKTRRKLNKSYSEKAREQKRLVTMNPNRRRGFRSIQR